MDSCPLLNRNETSETLITTQLPLSEYCCNGKKYISLNNVPLLFFTCPSFIIFIGEIVFLIIHMQKKHHFFTQSLFSCCIHANDEEMQQLHLSSSDSDSSHTSFV